VKKLFQKMKKRQAISCIAIVTIAIFAASLVLPTVSASQEIVGSDYHYGTQLGISEVLYKDTGEQDPNYDYYAVKVMLADVMYQNDPWTGPLMATVRIAVPLWAGEPPGSHQPQAGFYWSQNHVTFGFQGISFGMDLPAYSVSYSTSTDDNFRYFDWTIDGSGWWFVYEDWAEFSIGIRVPQGYQPDVWVGGWAAWYTYYGLVFTYNSEESYHWLHVTAPGDSPAPIQTPTIPAFPETPSTIQLQQKPPMQSDQVPSMPATPETPSTIPADPVKIKLELD
jgi:hypothetical protein